MQKRRKRRGYKQRLVLTGALLLGVLTVSIFAKTIISDKKAPDAKEENSVSNEDSTYEKSDNVTSGNENGEKNEIDGGADKEAYNVMNGEVYKEYHQREEYMLNVPYICQKDDYPTGCESVSAVMLLKYHGLDISVDDFIDKYLVMGGFYWDEDGIMHGEHPAEKFIGNPRENMAFGCYAPVIENAVKKLLSDKESELRVTLTTGNDLYELCRKYIDNDVPVLVWASMGMKPTREGRSWLLKNGEKFTWIAGEHCLVLVGYDDEYYYFNDPLEGKNIAYERDLAELRYNELGSQSLVLD